LKRSGVGRLDRSPTNRIEKSTEPFRWIEAIWRRKQRILNDVGTGLKFPDDAELFAVSVVVYRGEPYEMLALRVDVTNQILAKRRYRHIGNHKATASNADELPSPGRG
jgi:hypothetical protein